jgi:hypothetical protein
MNDSNQPISSGITYGEAALGPLRDYIRGYDGRFTVFSGPVKDTSSQRGEGEEISQVEGREKTE